MDLKREYSYERKIKPEITKKGAKNMFISYEVWKKLWPIIENMYWKVQNGIIFWYATQVWQHPWEDKVFKLLTKLNVNDAHSKTVCSSVFGVLSKFFRKLRDCSQLVGYHGTNTLFFYFIEIYFNITFFKFNI